jgi:hypothetical protein
MVRRDGRGAVQFFFSPLHFSGILCAGSKEDACDHRSHEQRVDFSIRSNIRRDQPDAIRSEPRLALMVCTAK